MICPAAGTVAVNGQQAASSFVRSQSAYVPQFDNFIPTMTVREVLQFYGLTILPTRYSHQDRENKVEAVMETMGLWSQADTLVRSCFAFTFSNECCYTGVSCCQRQAAEGLDASTG